MDCHNVVMNCLAYDLSLNIIKIAYCSTITDNNLFSMSYAYKEQE